MKLENMSDRLPERKESEPSAEEVKFVTNAMEEVSDSLSRYAITPTPDATLRIKEALEKEDYEKSLAEALADVIVIDSHFEPQNLSIENDQGLVDIAELTRAKVKAVYREIEDNDLKRKLEELGDRAILNVGKVVASTTGKRGATALAGGALSLMLTSCGISGEVAGQGSVETPSATEPRTEEVLEATSKEEVVPTKEATDTPEPTPTVVEEGQSDDEKIQRLAEELDCLNPDGLCVREGSLIGTNIMNASFTAISTGEVVERELTDPETGEKLGTAHLVRMVTRDSEDNPRTVYVAVQLLSPDNSNIYARITNYLAHNFSEIDDQSPYSKEEIENMVQEGEQFAFGFSTTDVFEGHRDWAPSQVLGEIYDDNSYVESLQEFLNTNGVEVPEDPIYPTTLSEQKTAVGE